MKEITIIAKKRVIDHTNANKLKPYTIEVDKDLLIQFNSIQLIFSHTNKKYKNHLNIAITDMKL